jgi:DNA-binding response OmpR family regulator
MENHCDNSTSDPGRGFGHTVHIIESDTAALITLCEDLSISGLRVNGSTDPERAIECVGRTHPDVLICGLATLEIGVEELLVRARKASVNTRILLTSDRPKQQVLDHVEVDAGVELLLGPLTNWNLLQTLERMLGIEVRGKQVGGR